MMRASVDGEGEGVNRMMCDMRRDGTAGGLWLFAGRGVDLIRTPASYA